MNHSWGLQINWYILLSVLNVAYHHGVLVNQEGLLREIDLSLAKCNGLNIHELTISQAHSLFQDGQLTPLDLTNCYIERIAQMDPFLHSVIELNPDAEDIATKLPKPDFNKYPLWGIPILVKDSMATTDLMNTTAGSFLLLTSKPRHEATVINRLRNAGAIILGKTNMSDLNGYRSYSIPDGWSSRRGQTINPYNSTMPTYGSSSGSAVAVSANLAMASLATDTCGSLISPAAAGMVVGSKASYGRVSNSGLVPLAPSLDSIGVMARTVEDNLIILDAIASFFPYCDSKYIPKLGVVRYPYLNRSEPETVAQFDKMVSKIETAGFEVIDDLTLWPMFYFDLDFELVIDVELKHFMAEYLTTTLGTVSSLADIIEINEKFPTISGLDRGYPQDFLIRAQNHTRGITSQSYIQSLINMKSSIINTIQDFMTESSINIIMIISDNELSPYIPASLAGFPIISVPAGLTKEGFPIGVSFYTVPKYECQLISFSRAMGAKFSQRTAPNFFIKISP